MFSECTPQGAARWKRRGYDAPAERASCESAVGPFAVKTQSPQQGERVRKLVIGILSLVAAAAFAD